MPDLNLDLDYFDHPKVKELQLLIGATADIYPIRLWVYCGRFHAEDGCLRGYSQEKAEKKVLRWRGKPGKLIAALIEVGILNKIRGGFSCHDWVEHQGHIQALKERNKKVAEARWKKLKDLQTTSGIPDASSGNQKQILVTPAVPSVPSKPSVPSRNGEYVCSNCQTKHNEKICPACQTPKAVT